MRYTLADSNTPRDFEFSDRLDRHQDQVIRRLRAPGAEIHDVDEETEYALPHRLPSGWNLKELADRIEDIPDCEVLSLGHSLEIVKDLGDAEEVAEQYHLKGFNGTRIASHVRMATESDVDISGAHPYWAYHRRRGRPNGQLTNYFQWKRRSRAQRPPLPVECDSEIIAVYLAEKMSEGASLEDAMSDSLEEARRRLHPSRSPDALGVCEDGWPRSRSSSTSRTASSRSPPRRSPSARSSTTRSTPTTPTRAR